MAFSVSLEPLRVFGPESPNTGLGSGTHFKLLQQGKLAFVEVLQVDLSVFSDIRNFISLISMKNLPESDRARKTCKSDTTIGAFA